jgi:O-antigen/teichoic acid export membrane protein
MDDPIRRLPRNALYNTAAAFLPLLVAVISTPFIVSKLGNEAFGLYLVALSVAGFAGLLDLGLGTASIKFISEYRARGDSQALSDFVNTLLLTRLPQALAVAFLGCFGASLVCSRVLMVSPDRLSEAVFVVRASILTLSVALIGGSLAALPRALHRFDIASRIGTLHGLLLTALTVVVLALGYGLRAIVLVELGLGTLSLVVSTVVARHLLPEWRPAWRFAGHSLGQLLHFGGLTTLNALAGFVFLHANRVMIGRSQGLAAVPYFAIPWSITSRVTQLTAALTEAMTPVASALSAEKADARIRALYVKSSGLTAVVATTALVPVGVSAHDLLTLWLGPVFGSQGGGVLRVLAVSALVQSLGAVPYFILTGVGRPGAANAPTLVAATANVVLAPILLPRFGLLGVAVAILAGLVAQTLLLVYSVEQALELRGGFVAALARPLAAAGVAAAVGLMSASQLGYGWARLFVSCSSAALVQQALLVATGCYGLRELRMIRGVVLPGAGRSATLNGGAR